MKKKIYNASIIIKANSKELKGLLEQIENLCEEKDCVIEYDIVHNLDGRIRLETEAEYDNGYEHGEDTAGLDDKDAKDIVKIITNNFKKGQISESYYEGFIQGYNDNLEIENQNDIKTNN